LKDSNDICEVKHSIFIAFNRPTFSMGPPHSTALSSLAQHPADRRKIFARGPPKKLCKEMNIFFDGEIMPGRWRGLETAGF